MRVHHGAAAALSFALLAAGAQAQEAFVPGLGTWQDRALIENTLQRYIAGYDQNDPELFASAFTPEGVFEFNDDVYEGRAAIAEYIAARNRGRAEREAAGTSDPSARLYHVTTNSVIVFEDETHATHTAYGMTIGRTTGETHISSSGSYADRLVKTEEGWLIEHRLLDQLPVFNPNAVVTPDGEVIVPDKSSD